MPTRYSAPPHIMSVFTLGGEARVIDGFVELPDGAHSADHQALLSVGFKRAPDLPAPARLEPSYPTAMDTSADE